VVRPALGRVPHRARQHRHLPGENEGPAQAPVLHRRVLLPPGVLPARGPAARHPRARRPRLHLAVAVLGLGPPPHGGDPGHQAGQQTTAGRAPAARHAALLPAADDGGVPRRGRQARHLARAARSPAAAPPAPARDTRVRLVHTQVSAVRSCLGAAVHGVPADVLRPPRHRARAHGLRVRAAEVLRGVRRGVLLGARQRGRHPRQVQCSWPGPPQAAPRVETFKQNVETVAAHGPAEADTAAHLRGE